MAIQAPLHRPMLVTSPAGLGAPCALQPPHTQHRGQAARGCGARRRPRAPLQRPRAGAPDTGSPPPSRLQPPTPRGTTTVRVPPSRVVAPPPPGVPIEHSSAFALQANLQSQPLPPPAEPQPPRASPSGGASGRSARGQAAGVTDWLRRYVAPLADGCGPCGSVTAPSPWWTDPCCVCTTNHRHHLCCVQGGRAAGLCGTEPATRCTRCLGSQHRRRRGRLTPGRPGRGSSHSQRVCGPGAGGGAGGR